MELTCKVMRGGASAKRNSRRSFVPTQIPSISGTELNSGWKQVLQLSHVAPSVLKQLSHASISLPSSLSIHGDRCPVQVAPSDSESWRNQLPGLRESIASSIQSPKLSIAFLISSEKPIMSSTIPKMSHTLVKICKMSTKNLLSNEACERTSKHYYSQLTLSKNPTIEAL